MKKNEEFLRWLLQCLHKEILGVYTGVRKEGQERKWNECKRLGAKDNLAVYLFICFYLRAREYSHALDHREHACKDLGWTRIYMWATSSKWVGLCQGCLSYHHCLQGCTSVGRWKTEPDTQPHRCSHVALQQPPLLSGNNLMEKSELIQVMGHNGGLNFK